jgi:hypothetical protein
VLEIEIAKVTSIVVIGVFHAVRIVEVVAVIGVDEPGHMDILKPFLLRKNGPHLFFRGRFLRSTCDWNKQTNEQENGQNTNGHSHELLLHVVKSVY